MPVIGRLNLAQLGESIVTYLFLSQIVRCQPSEIRLKSYDFCISCSLRN